MERNSVTDKFTIKYKICLLGDGGVGKTSLIRRFVLDQFDDKYLATFGTKISKKTIEIDKDNDEDINLHLMIWDVMGQKEFKKAQKHAYNNCNGALIVCDLTRYNTLESIESWCEDLFSVTDEVPIIILANKNDLHDQATFKEEDLEKISKKLNAPFLLTSAKTGNNVETAFLEIGKRIFSKS